MVHLTHLHQNNGYKSYTIPPPNLRLQDAPPPTRARSSHSVVNSESDRAPASDPSPPINPFHHGPYGPAYSGYPFPYSNAGPYQYRDHPVMPAYHHEYAPCSPYDRGSRYEQDAPSSDPIEQLEEDATYPLLQTWLQSLDDGPQGSDGHNFASYAANLVKSKCHRLSDIESLTLTKLMEICSGIPQGTANKLIFLVRKDLEKIWKRVKKAVWEEKYQRERGTRNSSRPSGSYDVCCNW